MYKEDNYKNICEFALEEYGLARSTVNHCMRVNEEFSENGNSPIVEKRYREFSKSQLQEMLYIPEELRNDVKSNMTVKEIRMLNKKRLDVEPEKDVENPEDKTPKLFGKCLPKEYGYTGQGESVSEEEMRETEIPGQMNIYDFPEAIQEPEEAETPRTKAADDRKEEEYIDDIRNDENEDDAHEMSEYEFAREQLRIANVQLSDMLKRHADEDKMHKQKILVAALACYIYELDNIENSISEQIQPELPKFRNNDHRKQWLRNYKDWGLWYEDEHIGCKYYKYDFENGARLIAEAYHVSKTSFFDERDNCYLHLVGGPEPPRAKSGGYGKWQRHDSYSKYPSSETELVEFLKHIQKEE